jgi:DNA-binding transcriptional ArsR family regulator
VPKPGGCISSVTAREIAAGTGMSLSSTYRALRELEELGLVIVARPERPRGRQRKEAVPSRSEPNE